MTILDLAPKPPNPPNPTAQSRVVDHDFVCKRSIQDHVAAGGGGGGGGGGATAVIDFAASVLLHTSLCLRNLRLLTTE